MLEEEELDEVDGDGVEVDVEADVDAERAAIELLVAAAAILRLKSIMLENCMC